MSDDFEAMVRWRLAHVSGERFGAGERSGGAERIGVGQRFGAGQRLVPRRPTPAPPFDEPSSSPPSPPSPEAGHTPSRLGGPGAFDPGRRGVKALAAVATVVAVVAAGWAWWSRPEAEPVTATPSATIVSGERSGGSESVVGPASSPGAAEVVVAVAGRVRRPGLVRLPAGARVADALEAAGGALAGVDLALLNLARKVNDGELILVGVTAPPGVMNQAGNPAGPAGAPYPGAQPGGAKVNLNTATLAELDTLPGVGPVLAQHIIDHRTQHGGFRSVSELRQVNGIGDARYEDLKDLVTV